MRPFLSPTSMIAETVSAGKHRRWKHCELVRPSLCSLPFPSIRSYISRIHLPPSSYHTPLFFGIICTIYHFETNFIFVNGHNLSCSYIYIYPSMPEPSSLYSNLPLYPHATLFHSTLTPFHPIYPYSNTHCILGL